MPGAVITVVGLRVPLATLHARFQAREAPDDLGWYLDAANHPVDRMEVSGVDDRVVDNTGHPAEVAATILRLTGWLRW